MPFHAIRLRRAGPLITYATLNPSDKGDDTGIVLSGGNLIATVGLTPTAGRYYLARSTMGKSSGKWYWETFVERYGPGGNNYSYGSCVLCNSSYLMEQTSANYPGLTSDVAGGPYFLDGTYVGGVSVKAFPTGTNATIRHKLDMDAGTYEQAFDSGSFTTVMTGLSGSLFPASMAREGSEPPGAKGFSIHNFGQSSFAYSVPSGFNPGVFTTA